MTKFTTFSDNEGARRARGGMTLGAPFGTELVVSVDGKLKGDVLARHERDRRAADSASSIGAASGSFGSCPAVGVAMPGGALAIAPRVGNSPYALVCENAYVRVSVTRSPFLPALRIEFKPYSLSAESPFRLELVRRTISGHFLEEERAVRVSRFGMAIDFTCPGFRLPADPDVLTGARTRMSEGLPGVSTPIFGTPSGGPAFQIFDRIVIEDYEQVWWPGHPRIEYDGGPTVWRAEFCFHRTAIRGLGLGQPGGTRCETIPDLANSVDILMGRALGGDSGRPWVRVAAPGTATTKPARRPNAWWWEPLRDAFLAYGVTRPTAASGSRAASAPAGWWRRLSRTASTWA